MERHLERPRRAAACATVLALSLSLGGTGAAYGNEDIDSGTIPDQPNAILVNDAASIDNSGAQEDGAVPAPDAPSANDGTPGTDAPAEEPTPPETTPVDPPGTAEEPPANTEPPEEGTAGSEAAGETPSESEGDAKPDGSEHDDAQVDDGTQPDGGTETPGSSDGEVEGGNAGDSTGAESPTKPDDGSSAPSDTPPSTEGQTETAGDDPAADATMSPTTEESTDKVEGSDVENLIATLAVTDGWSREGGTWHHYTNGKLDTGWLVTGVAPGASSDSGLQRYWLDPKTGELATSRLISASEAGWWAYATPSGAVVRGKWTDPSTGYVYLADNDGKLESAGWLVTGAYTGGDLQRYWLESRSGYSVAKTGLFSVGNDYYFGRSTGYVVRGRWTDSSTGYIYLADNDGKLIGGKSGGWVVTGYFTGGDLQRYYIDPKAHAAIPGYSSAGWAHYTTSNGYVLRGKLATGNHVLLANNDGKLASNSGWLVTATYDGGLQRYWIESLGNGYYGARTGSFQVDGASYYGTSNGYVLRNAVQQIGNTWYRADNDGKLTAGPNSTMWARAQQYTSATNYLLLIDSTSHTVGVFQGTGKAYEWNQLSAWPCGNGAWSTPTVKGIFTIQNRGYSFGSGYTCYYWTQFYGDYLFHSILYWPGTFIVQDGTLGASVSHGCVRLSLENAKWIYDNIPRGTTVVSY